MEQRNKLLNFSIKVQSFRLVRAIRDGLVNMIPILIIGAFALILKTFPVKAYLSFIENFAGGFILTLLNLIYNATFGMLSVYMAFSISRSYMKLRDEDDIVHGGAIFASIVVFFILTGSLSEGFILGNMGPKSMLLAIISGLGASAMYITFCKLLKSRRQILTSGADRVLNKMLSTLFPIMIVVASFALGNALITRIFNMDSFHELYITALNKLFSVGSNGFFKGFFFVLLSSVLWFFGVHGSDALEGVMQEVFVPNLAINQALVENGGVATEVLTKQFFDCFVLMGGCGATICLLIAILIFSKNRARRGLGLTAAFPMAFNINELMVFGLPIIFNPVMLIPFLLVPLVCYSISYLALATGIVPMIATEIEWTTPIIMGGYYATGSIAGSLLQIFNVLVGVAIYFPFVKILDRQAARINEQNYEEFRKYFIENEQNLQNQLIINMNNMYGDFAKELSAELSHDLKKYMDMFYQPQYDYDGSCVGVEALMRYNHPTYGTLYPPIVVKLLTECGKLKDLEIAILERVLEEKAEVYKKYDEGIKISINITGTTVVNDDFLDLLEEKNKEYNFKNNNICIEVTEKEDLPFNDDNLSALRKIVDMGITLAIDDFSMGQTSINYLKYDLFSIIKIDGGLVKGLTASANCREIIASIGQLAASLNMKVVAEFVQTEEEKEILHNIGVDYFQGYLYSPAKPLKEK